MRLSGNYALEDVTHTKSTAAVLPVDSGQLHATRRQKKIYSRYFHSITAYVQNRIQKWWLLKIWKTNFSHVVTFLLNKFLKF